ncbi:MAG TPA: NAD(P)-dependent alcohol dehydrogenase [Anaerolineales bacterium]|nr:NAD(P)-dependent alcohol dehydrogenase [Anaerolineales bacterium]
MKAIVYSEYGTPDVLKLTEVAKPVPRENEVLVKTRAVSINGSDWEALVGRPLYVRIGGLRRPGSPVLGSDVAGIVESIGSNVKEFQPGDEVFGDTPNYAGGFAEYVRLPESRLVRKPPGLTFEQVSAIPQAGVIALQGMRHAHPGGQVLINGAGGSAGSFAIQLAKLRGAEVTGVDNTEKLDFMRSLGADHVIDYTQEDFTRTGKQYDLILDVIAHRSVFAYKRALKPNGTYFFVGGSVGTLFPILFLGPWIRRISNRNIRLLAVQPNRKDLIAVTELCEQGTIVPVIDRVYSFTETAAAMRYVGERRANGKVVITLDEENPS